MKKPVLLIFALFIMGTAFGEEIANTLRSVKNAKPGDYIVMKDGSRYVLVAEEIAIVNDEFDYSDTAALKENEVPRADGGVEYNITSAHKRIVWPDEKSMDVLTTRRAFDDYLKFLVKEYDPIPFVNRETVIGNSYPTGVPEGLQTFRAKVYHTFLTNGKDNFDFLEVKEFNRTITNEGIERGFQKKGGTIVTTLSGGGNLIEAGARHDE